MGDRADEPFQLVIANDLEFREAVQNRHFVFAADQ